MLRGHVDQFSNRVIGGWAFDDAQPDRPSQVTIAFDDQPYATITADLPRPERDLPDCGFRFVLPPELRSRKARPLVSIRFAASGTLLSQSPSYLRLNNAPKRVLVLIPAGFRYNHNCIKAHNRPLKDHISTYINTGDWTVYDSSLKLLDFVDVQVANIINFTDADVERYNSEFDYAFLRGSNFINETMQWERAAELISRLKIPVIAFAVGAQAETKRKLNIPEAGVEVWRQIADHSATLGVRGTYSAEVLNDIGIHNVDIIGCPSLFRCNNPYLKIRMKPAEEVRKVAFNLRREVSRTYAVDIERYLKVQKRAVLTLNAAFDLTCTAHGEPAEKAYFYQDAELKEQFKPALVQEGWFDGDDDPMVGVYERQLFYGPSVAEYEDFVRTMDLVLGFRVHGNLPALANGVPAIFVDYDQRSQELATTLSIPQLSLNDLDGLSVDGLLQPDLFDDFNAAFPANYRRMANFLERNGMSHTMVV